MSLQFGGWEGNPYGAWTPPPGRYEISRSQATKRFLSEGLEGTRGKKEPAEVSRQREREGLRCACARWSLSKRACVFIWS